MQVVIRPEAGEELVRVLRLRGALAITPDDPNEEGDRKSADTSLLLFEV